MAQINDPRALVDRLREEPRETEWLEFKKNWFDQEHVGKYVSGLANSAILHDQDRAYLIFGIDDTTHDVVGTQIRLKDEKVGGQIYEHWLCNSLSPRINIEFCSFDYDEKHIEIIVIDPAYISPVRFKSDAYIRVDTALQNLRNQPEKERMIWAITSRFSFEKGIAASHVSEQDIFLEFYCEDLMKRLGRHNPSKGLIIEYLLMDGLILDDMQGGLDVKNLLR